MRVIFVAACVFYAVCVWAQSNFRETADYDPKSETGPPIGWRKRVGKYGIQLVKDGELRQYHKVWKQIFIIKRPELTTYNEFLDSLDLHCMSYRWDPGASNETKPIDFEFFDYFKERCLNYGTLIRNVSQELIQAAFSQSLPQPLHHINRDLVLTTDYAKVLVGSIRRPDFSKTRGSKVVKLIAAPTGGQNNSETMPKPVAVDGAPIRQPLKISDEVGSETQTELDEGSETTETPATYPPGLRIQKMADDTRPDGVLPLNFKPEEVEEEPDDYDNEDEREDNSLDQPNSVGGRIKVIRVKVNKGTRRGKRQIDLVSFGTALAAAAIAVSAQATGGVALYEVRVLEERVNELFRMREASLKKTIVIAESLLGLSDYSAVTLEDATLTLKGQTKDSRDVRNQPSADHK